MEYVKNINICLSCDDNYAKYAAVVIASVLTNKNEEDNIHFYILDGNISSETKSKILELKNYKNCEIDFIEIDEKNFEIYTKIKTHEYITLQTYYRLKLSEILPNIDKIIYLDCDMIVNSSLKTLFETDLGNNIIAGVLDARVKHKRKWKNSNYINAGMILFDLQKIRNENIEEKFIEYTKNNIDTIETGDQDIINFTLENKIKILPDEWNVQVSGFANRTSYTKHPKIIHYIGSQKPWMFGAITYFKNLYFENLQFTAWALSEEDKQKWYKENKKSTIIKFLKKRPLFFLNPKYWYAFFCSFPLNI